MRHWELMLVGKKNDNNADADDNNISVNQFEFYPRWTRSSSRSSGGGRGHSTGKATQARQSKAQHNNTQLLSSLQQQQRRRQRCHRRSLAAPNWPFSPFARWLAHNTATADCSVRPSVCLSLSSHSLVRRLFMRFCSCASDGAGTKPEAAAAAAEWSFSVHSPSE